MNKKTFLTMTLVTVLLLSVVVVTSAVHDAGLFELDTRAGVDGDQDKKNDPIPPVVGDGNTIDEAAPGDDWENVYGGTSSAFATSFVEDTFANNNINNGAEPFVVLRTPEISFFTGGGSKDTNGIQDGPWKYKVVSDQVPDKNDIINAFAAAYDDPDDGHTIFYFGLDTFSVKGDANAGFWFFRNPVGLNPLEPGKDTGTFSGEHRDGDVFVAVAYTQGGRVGDIDVYEWQGDDATGSLVQILEGQDCASDTLPANDDVCGVINKLLPDQVFGEDPVFDYANKLVANNPLDPTSYQYESAALVEFGLDVNAILGQEIGCFTTFLAETRSSQSETAQLKDFAFGAFPICSIAVDKTGDELSKVGDDVDYEIVVTNDGKATLYKQSITDTVLGDLTGDAGCGASLAPGDSCTIKVTYTIPDNDPDPLVNEVTVVYTEFADPLSLSFTDSASHSVNLFQPSITMTKTGTELSKVGDPASWVITLNNTSSDDTPPLECTITDAMLGFDVDVTLASGESHVLRRGLLAIPADAPDPMENTASASCSPVGFDNNLEASASHSVNLFQPSITLEKTGTELSKVGDPASWVITLNNTSSGDTPDLECTITDAMLGFDVDVTLASGESHVLRRGLLAIPADAPDPMENTASASCSPVGFDNVLNKEASHEVNLFQPSITLDKTGTELSKVGDPASWVITLNNTSSPDTPDLECTIKDEALGFNVNVTLASGESHALRRGLLAVPANAPDPMVNTASASCSPVGFDNVLTDSDKHEVNLFQPSVTIDKTGDALSKVGDPVDYVITVTNTSSADSPNLTCTIADPLLGINKVVNLPPKGVDVTNATRVVQAGDPDPLTNTASVTCGVDGFSNVLGPVSDFHTVELFQPAVEVIKTGPDRATRGETITYDFTINNLSSADSPDLILDSVTDTVIGDLTAVAAAGGCGTLASSGTCNFTADYTIPSDASSPLVNVVTVHYNPFGFPNDVTDEDDHSLILPGFACTPGFWQGGNGALLWDQGPPDPDWTASAAEGDNPFIHTTSFNGFFSDVTEGQLAGYDMITLVSNQADPKNSATRAARDMVAAYLNGSAAPSSFGITLEDLLTFWYATVSDGSDAAYDLFHQTIGPINQEDNINTFCTLP